MTVAQPLASWRASEMSVPMDEKMGMHLGQQLMVLRSEIGTIRFNSIQALKNQKSEGVLSMPQLNPSSYRPGHIALLAYLGDDPGACLHAFSPSSHMRNTACSFACLLTDPLGGYRVPYA